MDRRRTKELRLLCCLVEEVPEVVTLRTLHDPGDGEEARAFILFDVILSKGHRLRLLLLAGLLPDPDEDLWSSVHDEDIVPVQLIPLDLSFGDESEFHLLALIGETEETLLRSLHLPFIVRDDLVSLLDVRR